MGYLLVKDVYGRYLLVFKSRKFDNHRKRYGNGNVHVGCIISVWICRIYVDYMSRRGLTALLILWWWAMREPEDWDKREVETPTSFLVSYTLHFFA